MIDWGRLGCKDRFPFTYFGFFRRRLIFWSPVKAVSVELINDRRNIHWRATWQTARQNRNRVKEDVEQDADESGSKSMIGPREEVYLFCLIFMSSVLLLGFWQVIFMVHIVLLIVLKLKLKTVNGRKVVLFKAICD